jgi:redox-sensitive bicupin YhaK (pirin superfamily)
MSTFGEHEPGCIDATADHAVELVIEGRPRDVGSFSVSRLLPVAKRRMIGPFIFFDHMGPIEIAPGAGFDVRPHPHIGLSTLTYFFAGENVHRDSLGTVQINRPGDINLMTAGRGVVHSERAEPAWRERGGLMHGLQIWLALPEANEDDAPAFEHIPRDTVPQIAPGPGARGRVLAGRAFGASSPLRHPSAPLLVDLELAAGASIELPEAPERGVFVVHGEVQIGAETIADNRLAVIAPAARACLSAVAPSRVLVLGGAALGPRFIDWNFVASSQDRIDRAREAWKARTFPEIPSDHDEFVPYPDLHR